jgi:tetratricopeptide (TPR) repeat protein
MIAELFARLGMFEQAELYESEPGVGQLYWQRRWQDLIDLGETLILEYPNETEIWYALAWAYNATGRYRQTIRLLEMAGLPEYALEESRRSIDVEATMTLADAHDATGNKQEAHSLAHWYVEHLRKMNEDIHEGAWWADIYLACAFAILRRDDEALDTLDEVASAKGLVWYPLVADAHCFQRFAESDRYRRVLSILDERKADLRHKVPMRLRNLGLSLEELDASE